MDWMSQQPAPVELLEIVSSFCTAGCVYVTGRCSCHKAGLSCTDACLCTRCENTRPDGEAFGPGDEAESSDIDSDSLQLDEDLRL